MLKWLRNLFRRQEPDLATKLVALHIRDATKKGGYR
mgnify:FL=1